MEKIDILIIGAGVIGVAIGRALAMAGRDVIVADAENIPGSVTTARNSGVIHAGIYYRKGSQKAKHCLNGKKRLYHYIIEKQIPYENCQKLIVACHEEERTALRALKEKAASNGVDDLKLLSAQDAVAMEPELSCVEALLSPSTGIIDVHAYLMSLIHDLEQAGGVLALGNAITSGVLHESYIDLVLNEREQIRANFVINAAGIAAQRIAHNFSGMPKDKIPPQYLAKGNYFTISGPQPFTRLIYPVPVAGGLGAHYTKNMAGESLFGPDVEWIEPQDYRHISYDVDEGRAEKFYGYIEKYWPAIRTKTLRPGYAGVRPKLVGAGQPDGDFMLQGPKDHGIPNLINLFGIESPGLTASLSIASEVKEMVFSR